MKTAATGTSDTVLLRPGVLPQNTTTPVAPDDTGGSSTPATSLTATSAPLLQMSDADIELLVDYLLEDLQNYFRSYHSLHLSQHALHCHWKLSYREIYPNRDIKKKIKNLKLPSKDVGVHIRATDKLVSLFTKLFELPSKTTIINSQLNLFLKSLDKQIYLNTNIKNVYLSCDDKNIKKFTLNLLKKNGL